MAAVDLDERHHREQPEDEDLGAEQELLDARRELDAAVADPGHDRDPQHRGDDDRRFGFAEFGEAEELEGVDRRDRRQRGHHDHVGEEDRPAVHPARHRAERARDPRERRARVGVGAVEVFVGRGDQQHRDERHEHHRGRVHADALDGDDEPQRRRQRVGRRRGGDPDHDVGEVADRVFLQALVHHPRGIGCTGFRDACSCHLISSASNDGRSTKRRWAWASWQTLRPPRARDNGRDPQSFRHSLYILYNEGKRS